MVIPVITVFVRHGENCKYKGDGDDTNRKIRCTCRKHLRWSADGVQYRTSAKTGSWTEAEEKKRALEAKFAAGDKPVAVETGSRKTIEGAIELFLKERRSTGLSESIVQKYDRELGRFRAFCEANFKMFPAEIDLEILVEYRDTWGKLYPSSATRQQVQTRLRRFLRFCHNAGWIERIPSMSAISVDEPPTLPLSAKQYTLLLATIPEAFPEDPVKRVRVRGTSTRDALECFSNTRRGGAGA